MNILVTGADGQLGRELRSVACESKDSYLFTDVAELDITDADAVRRAVCDRHVDVLVNCAAYTDVERAEDDPEQAERLNAAAVKHLAEAMKEVDGLLVHISTDYVFGGNGGNTPRDESEPTNPTGVYGRTKLLGEQAVVASGCRYLIFRTAWLYSEFGKNFVKTVLDLTASRSELSVVFDQTGTPTYAYDLAVAIFDILENRRFEGRTGLYHYSDEGTCSWYDFARMIADIAGRGGCDIRPCRSDEFPSKVVRPSFSVLDKTKFKAAFGLPIPYWVDSLRLCIDRLKAKP